MAQSVDMLLVYVVGWGIVFGTFVHYYHKRKAQALTRLESFFPSHPTRDFYYELVALKEKDPKLVTTAMLQSALIRRTIDNVLRAVNLQSNKQCLTQLVSSGAISQDLQHQFNSAEAELESEMLSVRHEADQLVDHMGDWIFQVSAEILGNSRQRELREEILKLEIENLNCIANLPEGTKIGADYKSVNMIKDEQRDSIIQELIQSETNNDSSEKGGKKSKSKSKAQKAKN
ncbi:Translocation protein sec66 [Smittium mucronatum]|uniref:Translocation protein sec66 n=1 Tax=Smittium mucronatum TaxID=133383 RepID=A0A1R0H5X6_9FUNG|nr:Translocation protein sec66 [Smittium mucronatum]